MAQRLDVVVRRSAIVASLLAVTLMAATLTVSGFPRLRDRFFSSHKPQGYVVGDHLSVLRADTQLAHRTIVLFARHDCSACQRSKAQFTALVTRFQKTPSTQVVLAAPEPLDEDDLTFGQEIGLLPSRVLGLVLRGTRIRRAPSVAVVDESGKILMFHEGVLTSDVMRQVATAAGG
jgi:hypothetical protein